MSWISFKPDIDDLRGSSALHIALSLKSLGFDVLVVEPNIKSYESLSIVSLEKAVEQADLFVMLVKHKEFLVPNIKARLVKKVNLDYCGLLV